MIQIARPNLAVAHIAVVIRRHIAPRPCKGRDDRARVELVLGHLDDLGAVEEQRRGVRRRAEARGVQPPAGAVGAPAASTTIRNGVNIASACAVMLAKA